MSDKLPLGDRVLDRCNPILVREIQQAVNGRAFLVTVSVALSCVAIIAMMIAASGSGWEFKLIAWSRPSISEGGTHTRTTSPPCA